MSTCDTDRPVNRPGAPRDLEPERHEVMPEAEARKVVEFRARQSARRRVRPAVPPPVRSVIPWRRDAPLPLRGIAPRCMAMSFLTGDRCEAVCVKGSDRCLKHGGVERAPHSGAALRAWHRGDYGRFGRIIRTGPPWSRSRWRRAELRALESDPGVPRMLKAELGSAWVAPRFSRGHETNLHARAVFAMCASWLVRTGDARPWLAALADWERETGRSPGS